MRDILADLLTVAEEIPVKQKLYDLWMVRVNPRTGEPTGQESKVGDGTWQPMSRHQARVAKATFTEYRWRRMELREVVAQ
jgi:hypothetical protein